MPSPEPSGGASRLSNRWPLEQRVFYAVLLAFLPSTLTVIGLLWFGDYSERVRWTLLAAVAVSSVFAWLYLRDRMAYSLRTIANLLAAIREGDFSLRVRGTAAGDALDEVIDEANALRDMLHAQRIEVAESGALLERVLDATDAAVVMFDTQDRLRRANKRAEGLLGASFPAIEGRTAAALGLNGCLEGEGLRMMALPVISEGRKWEMRRTTVRQHGEPMRVVMLWDVTLTLRLEEQEAWSRLVRVLRHEINNALAPISSLAGTMLQQMEREPLPPEWHDDFRESLEVIAHRSTAIVRLLHSYTELSSEPAPERVEVSIAPLIARAASIEVRADVAVAPGPEITAMLDPGQVERALVNLIRNAVDANLETGGAASIGWRMLEPVTNSAAEQGKAFLEIWVEDEGAGLPNEDNLFVPFFTTKPGGSGVGLALARQIAEAHGGSLTLANRSGGRGCRSTLRLPLDRS